VPQVSLLRPGIRATDPKLEKWNPPAANKAYKASGDPASRPTCTTYQLM